MTDYTPKEQEEAYKKTINVTAVVLARVLRVVDIASQRGAFKGEEMTFVGNLYDTLKGGVDQAMVLARKELKEAEEKAKLETIPEETEEDVKVEEVKEEVEETEETIPVENSVGVQTVSG